MRGVFAPATSGRPSMMGWQAVDRCLFCDLVQDWVAMGLVRLEPLSDLHRRFVPPTGACEGRGSLLHSGARSGRWPPNPHSQRHGLLVTSLRILAPPSRRCGSRLLLRLSDPPRRGDRSSFCESQSVFFPCLAPCSACLPCSVHVALPCLAL